MSRFPISGSIASAADPSKTVLEYTEPLSDNTFFPYNSTLPNSVFLCYDNSMQSVKSAKVYFGIPQQSNKATAKAENYINTRWSVSGVSKPVLYRVDSLVSDIYGTVYPDKGIAFKAHKEKSFQRYALPTYVDLKVFDEEASPTFASANKGSGNNGWAWGLESIQDKGVNYTAFHPVVNYNPNSVVVVPYLARYYEGPNGMTMSYIVNSPTYHNQDILMLDDILNDTIISGIGSNNEYSLKYFLVIDGQISYTTDYPQTGSPRKYLGYYLSPFPIAVSKPQLYSYFETRTQLYDYIYPEICQDLYLPLWNGTYTLIGTTHNNGMASSTTNNIIVDMSYTGYSELGTFTLGTYNVYDEGEGKFVDYTVEDTGARPYVTVADLSGANRELYDNLVRTTASLGMAFCTSWASLSAIRTNRGITDTVIDDYPDSIYYPVINEKAQVIGVTHGQANKTNPLKQAGDHGTNPFDEIPEIDPDDENDHNDYIDETPLREFLTVNPSNAFNTRYALNEDDIRKFEDFLWTGDQSIVSNVLDGLKMFGENPMNFFLSLKMFPFDLRRFSTNTSLGHLRFGNGVVVTNHSGDAIYVTKLTDVNIVIDLGTINFRKFFKNFLDYEPYTTAKLYVPFCGEISVETSVFVGHEINIKLIVDIVTGACCAVVFRDKLACLSLNGNIAVDIPITGENYQEYINATKEFIATAGKAIDSALSMGTGVSNSAGSGTSTSRSLSNGSFSHSDSSSQSNNKMTNSHRSYSANGAISGLTSAIIGAYDWYHTPTALQISGSASDMCNLYKPMYAYFVIEQPVPMITPGYAENYGFATFDYGTLPPEGLVVCRNAHVQPATATEPETTELNELLNTGVWI